MNQEEKRKLCEYLGEIFGSDFKRQCMEGEMLIVCTYSRRGERVPEDARTRYCEILLFEEEEGGGS